MIPKWSSWVFLPVTRVVDLALPARLLEVQERALEGLAGVLAGLLPAEVVQQPVLGEGHRRGRRLLELEPARAQPDDRHVAVAADRRARGLADRAEAVRDGDAGGHLETLAGAGAVGEAVLERLLQAAQVVGLAERELGLGAARLDVVAGGRRAPGPGGRAGGAAVSGERVLGGGRRAMAQRQSYAWSGRTGGAASEATGVSGSRRGRAAERRGRPRPCSFPTSTTPNSRGRENPALSRGNDDGCASRIPPVGASRIPRVRASRLPPVRESHPPVRESLTPGPGPCRRVPVENGASRIPRSASRVPRSASRIPRGASGEPGDPARAATGAPREPLTPGGASRLPRSRS